MDQIHSTTGQHKPPQVIPPADNNEYGRHTNQNTDCCFVVIGLVGRQSHSPLQQLKIDPVRQLGQPYCLAASGCQRILINIRGQYGIQKNIFIHPCILRRPLYKSIISGARNVGLCVLVCNTHGCI